MVVSRATGRVVTRQVSARNGSGDNPEDLKRTVYCCLDQGRRWEEQRVSLAVGDCRYSLNDNWYCDGVSILGNLLQWKWVSHGVIKFAPLIRTYLLGNLHAHQFKTLCTAILVTHPKVFASSTRPERSNPIRQWPRATPSMENWRARSGDISHP